jgi:hypothetical protein
MLRIFLSAIVLHLSINALSQTDYFQQELRYTINATLYDDNHILRGFETIQYTNHSKDTLQFLYFHVWPNAFMNDKSEYVKQGVENGETDFYFSKKEEKGFIDSLDFKIDNQTVAISNYNGHEDILVLELNNGLAPEQKIEITTPFRLVIPANFSRLGHIEQTYQMSQWYPKPAVYDKDGWHPMPYLDQGEFYSEFASFDVTLTLPSSYLVVASGEVQQEDEKQFILSRHWKKNKNHVSTLTNSGATKTISFKQDHIHDFAWFADKELFVDDTLCTLSNGKKIHCYSYFKNPNAAIYQNSSAIIAKTILYFSNEIGDYPYSQVSVVEAPIQAGSGMEYPLVAVIAPTKSASELQTVIIHEVGHNWFYGILANNERDYAWLDEGLNSFYEQALDTKLNDEYTNSTKILHPLKQASPNVHLWMYQLLAAKEDDQKINQSSELFTPLNYGIILYKKCPAMLQYLQAYMGENVFSNAIKSYFKLFSFKHPSPSDFQRVFTNATSKDIRWFFDNALETTHKIDFAFKKVDYSLSKQLASIQIKNKTNFKGPVSVSALQGDSILETKWLNYPYNESILFQHLPEQTTRFSIDAESKIPEMKTSNNNYHIRSLFPTWQPAIRLGFGMQTSTKQKLFLMPIVAYNQYDSWMPGIVIHNIQFPNKKFQYVFAPMFNTSSTTVSGSGGISYTFIQNKRLKEICVGIQGRSYLEQKNNVNIDEPLFLRYAKLMPFAHFTWKQRNARSTIQRNLLVRSVLTNNQNFTYTLDPVDSLFRPRKENGKPNYFLHTAFQHIDYRTFHPYSYIIQLEGNQRYMKLSTEANIRIDYFKKNKAFYARIFAGKFIRLQNNSNELLLRNQYLQTTFTAQNDRLYDHVFLGRNEQNGLFSKQIALQEGGFKIVSNLQSTPIGQSDNWLTAINLQTDLPFSFPIKMRFFIDLGTFAEAGKINTSNNKLLYDGGLSLYLLKELIVIHAPFILSKDFQDYTKSVYPKNRWLQTMSFQINLHKIQWTNTQKYWMKLFSIQ